MNNVNESFCRIINIDDAVMFLKNNDNFIILTHASPDGDTLGAAFALFYGLKTIGKKVKVICPDDIPAKYDYFVCKTDDVADENAYIIAVDVADARLLGSLKDKYGSKVDLNIDHHISNVQYADYLLLDSNASAACEIIFDILEFMNIELDDVMAKAIYTGIATDTGCFKYSNVTVKTHIIASKLYAYNIEASEINRVMFDTKSKRLLELERMVLDTAEYYFDSRCMLLTVTSEMQDITCCSGTELEGISVISRSLEGVKVGVTLKQVSEQEFKVSMRTFEPFDASELCKKLGGGGHKAAAGASVKGNLNEVKNRLLSVVSAAMEEVYAGTVTA